jgi:hypothetical protein
MGQAGTGNPLGKNAKAASRFSSAVFDFTVYLDNCRASLGCGAHAIVVDECTEKTKALLERVRAGLGALSILRAGCAGNSDGTYDLGVGDERDAAFYRGCVMECKNA